jgi:hypothetical protein
MTCKTRVRIPDGSAGLPDELCPTCGSALERPGNLSELVGFRAVTWHDRPAEGGRASTHESLVDRLGALYQRPAPGQARLEGERRVDEVAGGAAEAVAMPRPETTC